MKRGKWLPFLILVAGLLTASTARADRRSFAFTYEPKVAGVEELEIEYYMTGQVKQNKLTRERTYGWAHQFEVEYGLVEGVDVSVYQMFSPAGWQGYKLRGRYMPLAPGELPIDFLLYLEFIQNQEGDVAFEERLILGRTFDQFIVALDSMTEQGPLSGDTGFKLGHSLAIGYAAAPWFTLGVETQLRMSWEPELDFVSGGDELEFSGTSLFVGPSVSFASKRMFWDFSFALRAQGSDDDPLYLFRMLWGIFI